MSAAPQEPVQASEPDLFGDAPAATPAGNPSANCAFVLRGRLAHKPHVANKPIDAVGHMVPVVVLELADVGAGHNHVVAHVPFTEATRRDAEALARRLRVDQVVAVTTSLTDIRVLLPAAALHHDEPA